VAHIAYERGTLPDCFSEWEIRNCIGMSLAHLWVKEKPLPPDFNLWTLRDRCGYNVAEMACIHRHMPPGITDFRDLINIAGTPKDIVSPLLPFPYSTDSWYQNPDIDKLPSIRSITTDLVRDDDFHINWGNFLDAFYLYRGKELREYMIKEPPLNTEDESLVPFLGASVAVLARHFDLSVPDWTFDPRCYYPDDDPYSPYSSVKLPKPFSDTPPKFLERNYYITGDFLYRI
jgi:hypothetical protein